MMDSTNDVIIYRRRFIPDEKVLLKDDEIIHLSEDIIITKWKVLKPRIDFARGYSCYFLKRNFKISKFIDYNDEVLYYYCDIIHTEFDAKANAYTFNDLLIDVIYYNEDHVKVVDIGELSEALDNKIIPVQLVSKALKTTDELLSLIYKKEFFSLADAIKDLN